MTVHPETTEEWENFQDTTNQHSRQDENVSGANSGRISGCNSTYAMCNKTLSDERLQQWKEFGLQEKCNRRAATRNYI